MEETPQVSEPKAKSWSQKQVYTLSAICVVVGLVFGYFLRGSEGSSVNASAFVPAATSVAPQIPQPSQGPQQMPSMQDMKRMADKQVEPLLAQLKNDPKNEQLTLKIAANYAAAHQFKEAAQYFQQALDVNPKNTAAYDELGQNLYYGGEVDKAIAVFEQGLTKSPNDPALLVDLGLVKFRNKGDAKGAVALWEQLLKNNPNIPADRKELLQKMIAEAKAGKPASTN